MKKYSPFFVLEFFHEQVIYVVLTNKAIVNGTNPVLFILINYAICVTGSPVHMNVCSYLLYTGENVFGENLPSGV